MFRSQAPEIPDEPTVPPDRNPPPPVEEPPDVPVTEPDAPVREPDPEGPKRLSGLVSTTE